VTTRRSIFGSNWDLQRDAANATAGPDNSKAEVYAAQQPAIALVRANNPTRTNDIRELVAEAWLNCQPVGAHVAARCVVWPVVLLPSRSGMSGIATKLKRIATRPEMSQPHHSNGEIDLDCATRQMLLMVGALVTVVVVNNLNALPLAAEYRDTMTAPTHRYRWTAHEPMACPDSWRRWPTDQLASFIVTNMTTVLPQFWWRVDGRDALALALRIIDGYRNETGLVESNLYEFIDSIRRAIIGFDAPG